MAEDISNKTVMILAVLTIVISALGTFTVLSSTQDSSAQAIPVDGSGEGAASGKISLQVGQPVAQRSTSLTGEVTIKINPNS
jgi:hypothetical protein